MDHLRPNDLRHVLIVEDDALVRMVGADILADAGFHTYEAGCAAEALAILQAPDLAGHIAVIVTDIDMPGELNGLQLAARVRQSWPSIGIVVTSGTQGFAASAARQALFIAKPYRAEALVAAVRSVMPQRAALLQRHAC